MFNLSTIKIYKKVNPHLGPDSWLESLKVNINAKSKANPGAAINLLVTTIPIRVAPLLKSLTTSAKGCRSPNVPTFMGPTRTWLKLNNFRSNRVKKATFRRIGTMIASLHSRALKRLVIALNIPPRLQLGTTAELLKLCLFLRVLKFKILRVYTHKQHHQD